MAGYVKHWKVENFPTFFGAWQMKYFLTNPLSKAVSAPVFN